MKTRSVTLVKVSVAALVTGVVLTWLAQPAGAVTMTVDCYRNGFFGYSVPTSPAREDFIAAFVFAGAGQTVQVSALGTVNVGDGLPSNGPDGFLVNRATYVFGYSPLEEGLVDSGTPVGNLPLNIEHFGALIGAFVPQSVVSAPGFAPRNNDAVSPGIASSQLFLLGSSATFTAVEPGTLFLGFNEPYVANNSGTFSVNITSAAVPEASAATAIAMLGLGAIAIAAYARRRFRRAA